jgi:hypothetical protein
MPYGCAIMSRSDLEAELRELVAQVAAHPAPSQETAAALAWVQERLMVLAASVGAAERPSVAEKPVCARCRRDVATELGRQAWMN